MLRRRRIANRDLLICLALDEPQIHSKSSRTHTCALSQSYWLRTDCKVTGVTPVARPRATSQDPKLCRAATGYLALQFPTAYNPHLPCPPLPSHKEEPPSPRKWHFRRTGELTSPAFSTGSTPILKTTGCTSLLHLDPARLSSDSKSSAGS